MYSDRSANSKRSIRDRLGDGKSTISSSLTSDRQFALKRHRQDDGKWSRGFSVEGVRGKPQLTSIKAVPEDLMAQDVQKDLPRTSKNGSQISARDVHEKIMGVTNISSTDAGPSSMSDIKRKSGTELIQATKPVTQNVSAPSFTGQKKQAVELTVTSFLKSIGLSKYAIIFQAEEVDMIAIKHMTDGDLKEIGLPMGPRKKILLALSSAKLKR